MLSEIKCKVCGKVAYPSPLAPRRFYCSGKCKQKAYWRRHRAKRIAASVEYQKKHPVLCNEIKRRSHVRCRAKLRTTAAGAPL